MIIAKLIAKIGADDSEFNQKLGSVSGKLGNFANKAKGIGTSLSLGVTMPLVGLGVKAVQTAADFEGSLNVLQYTTQATGAQMKEISALAVQLGNDMTLPGTSANDAAQAMLELSKAGLSVKETMSAAKGVLQLSAAAQIGNAEAAEIAANALNAFSLKGKDAGKIADMLANAANASSASMIDVAYSFKAGASVAQMAKMSIQDFTAAISLMANAGIKGQDAGTSIKSMMMSLINPGKAATNAMDELKWSMFDAAGKVKPINQAIGELNAKFKGMSDSKKLNLMGDLFGSDGIRAANILLKAGTEGFSKMAETVQKQGAAAGMAAAMNKGLKGALDGLNSAFETLLNTYAAPYLGMLTNAVKWIGNLLGKLNELGPVARNMAVAFGAIAAAIGPALLVIGSLAGAFSNLIALASTVGPALAGVGAVLSGPVGLAIAAAVAAIVALYVAWQNNFGGIRDKTYAFIEWLRPYLQQAWEGIKSVALSVWGAIRKFIEEIWPPLKTILTTSWNFISGLLTKGMTALQAMFGDSWGNIKGYFIAVWDILKGVVKIAWGVVAGIITVGLKLLAGDWKGAWSSFKDYLSLIWSGIKDVVGGALRAVGNLLATYGKAFFNLGKDIIMGLVNGIKAGVGWVVDAAKGVATSALNAAKSALGIQSPSKEFAKVGHFAALGFAGGIIGNIGFVVAAVKRMSKEALDALKDVRDKMFALTHSDADVQRRGFLQDYLKAIKAGVSQIDAGKLLSLQMEKIEKEEQALSAQMWSAGSAAAKSLADGLMAEKAKVEAAAKSVKDAVYEMTHSAFDVQRRDFVRAYADNLRAGVAQVDALKLLDLQVSKVDAEEAAAQLKEAGKAAAKGYADGITEGGGSVATAWEMVWSDFSEQLHMQKVVDAFGKNAEAIEGMIVDSAQTMQQSLAEGFQNGFKNVLSDFRGMLQKMAAEWLASQVMRLIGRNLGGLIGGKSGAAFGSIFENFGGFRADGGMVEAGRSYIVGEKGPEMVTFGSSGYVTPNHAMGGGGNVINMYIQTPDAASFQQSEGQVLGRMKRQIDHWNRRNG